MKTHRIFTKGEYVYCLLSSFSKPNILIPVKGIIIDTVWDPVNPLYKIKILKLYDNMKFLNDYFFDMKFKYDFDIRAKKMPLKKEDFKSARALEKRFNESDHHRFYVIVESIMCTKTRVNLQKLFERVQFYIISKNLKEIREISTRPFFKGMLSLDSVHEFDIRFKRGWADKFEKTKIDINKYLITLG
jgi:hypothetical protein